MTTLQNSTAPRTGSRHVGGWLPSPSALWELRGNSIGDLISQMLRCRIGDFDGGASRSLVHPTPPNRVSSSETISQGQSTVAETNSPSLEHVKLLYEWQNPGLGEAYVNPYDWYRLTQSDINRRERERRQTFDDRLSLALGDLRDSTTEAREEGFPIPSTAAIRGAERLVKAMYEISPWRFEVYPTPDGEIAIDAPNGRGSSVILLCDSDGGALCMAHLNGSHRSRRYSTTDALPDDFLREVLIELERTSS